MREVLLTSPGLVRTTPGLVKTTLGLVKTTPGLVEKTRHLPFTFSHPKRKKLRQTVIQTAVVCPAPNRLTFSR